RDAKHAGEVAKLPVRLGELQIHPGALGEVRGGQRTCHGRERLAREIEPTRLPGTCQGRLTKCHTIYGDAPAAPGWARDASDLAESFDGKCRRPADLRPRHLSLEQPQGLVEVRRRGGEVATIPQCLAQSALPPCAADAIVRRPRFR